MITEIEPRFGNEKEEIIKPDTYLYDTSKGYLEPNGNYIISRTEDAGILSCYEDDIWDVSLYNSSHKTLNLRFDAIKSALVRGEAKRLVFLYYLYGSGRYDGSISGLTLKNFFSNGIRPLSMYVEEKKLTIKQVIENKKHLENYIVSQITNATHRAHYLRTLLTLLESISNNETGIEYIKDKKNNTRISKLSKSYQDKQEQTELIPVSTYLNASKQRWEHIDRIKPKLNSLFSMLDACIDNSAFARKHNSQIKLANRSTYWRSQPNYVLWEDAVKRFRLTKLFRDYNVKDRGAFKRFFGLISATCRHLIHMNSGMRVNECRTLKQNCYLPPNDEMPPRIQGIERKMRGDPSPQVWVTTENIKRVINILVKIGNVIGKRYFPHLKKIPLIVSIAPLLNIYKPKKGRYTYNEVMSSVFPKNELPLDRESIIVTQKHMEEELEVIEPLRDWSTHKWLKVGEPWHFKSHQYRRSLAVYALGSGLVSLFSLKEQLGHLLSTITAYYGNGHLVAKPIDFTGDDDHISRYMDTMATELEALGFVHNVQLSKEPLFGAGGVFYEKHLVAKTAEAREQVFANLSDTIKKVKNGELHYKETAIGGCTALTPCDKYLFPSMINYCKDCEDNITKLSKLESWIERQRQFVLYLQKNEPDSIQHRTEVRNLLDNEEYLEWLRRKAEGKQLEEAGA